MLDSERAFPLANSGWVERGLSKREYAAVAAMQALLVGEEHPVPQALSQLAVECADALARELDKKKPT